MKNLFLVQDGNSRAVVSGLSVFRRPLSGITYFPTSDIAKPSCSRRPSLSYLDLLEDFCFSLFCFHGLLLSVADLSVSCGRRDGVREAEGRESEREREEGR